MATIEGKAYWASVAQPNTKFEPVYTVDLVVDDKIANDFASRGFKIKQMEAGSAISIKRKVVDKKGNTREKPRLLDAEGKRVDVLIGNGSEVRVQYNEWEPTNQFGNFKGLDLMGVRILNLVPYGGSKTDADELGELAEEEF